jgi:hypothetical protein
LGVDVPYPFFPSLGWRVMSPVLGLLDRDQFPLMRVERLAVPGW